MPVLHREDAKVARLREIELFAGADKSALQNLASAADEFEVPVGTVLIAEGHRHHEAYLVTKGSLSVVIGDKEVATIGEGELVGELGLFGGTPASATVLAKTDLAALAIPYNRFDQILNDNPALSRTIAIQLAERLRSMDLLYRGN